jgi:hypothetical protein
MGSKESRRHERKKADNRPLKLEHLNNYTLYILPTDESESGMGCIYTGNEPPDVGAYYSFEDKGTRRKAEVVWVTELTQGIYRLGLAYF